MRVKKPYRGPLSAHTFPFLSLFSPPVPISPSRTPLPSRLSHITRATGFELPYLTSHQDRRLLPLPGFQFSLIFSISSASFGFFPFTTGEVACGSTEKKSNTPTFPPLLPSITRQRLHLRQELLSLGAGKTRHRIKTKTWVLAFGARSASSQFTAYQQVRAPRLLLSPLLSLSFDLHPLAQVALPQGAVFVLPILSASLAVQRQVLAVRPESCGSYRSPVLQAHLCLAWET
ncbi:hypothetical protein B0H65DRAFT_322931 [Neurospora tetraspora]|uniref:Uncharacterized protein n=1 Tax=Neurospora tetraspora TaxID=94610 RepID=A0AAE0J7P8_9PEZI|nr:hypothetical protein B0H65DRAFT_322931 [Neurospora tetraspora]